MPYWLKKNVNQLTKVGVHNSSTDFSSLSKTYNDNARAAAANLEGSWKFKRILVKNFVKMIQIIIIIFQLTQWAIS